MSRGQTTKFPLCCVAMELAAQLEARGLDLSLEWIPRDANSEADLLADGDSSGFSDEHRVDADISKLGWYVLPGLLEEGTRFFNQGLGLKRPAPAQPRARGRIRLREKEPW